MNKWKNKNTREKNIGLNFFFFLFFILSFCARTKPPFGEWWVSHFYFRSSQNLPLYPEFHPWGLIGHILVLSFRLKNWGMENELFCGTERILECFPESTYTHILYNVEKIRRTKERKITIFFFWKVKWTFCWLIQKKYRTDKRHQTAVCGSKHQPWLSCTANLSRLKPDFDYDLGYVISMAIPCFLLVYSPPHTLSFSDPTTA